MGQKSKFAALLAGTALLTTGFGPAIGQEADTAGGGISMTLGLSSSLRVNDNLGFADPSPGTTTLWDNTLTFGVLSETGVAQLSFDAGATVRTANIPGLSADTTIDDPFVTIGYQIENADSIFAIEAGYSQVSLQFEDPLAGLDDIIDDGIDAGDLTATDGTRGTTSIQASFETGRNSPLGFGAEVSHEKIEYWDTTDAGNIDEETNAAEVFARFQFSPVLESRVTLSWEQYDELIPTGTSRQTLGALASVTYEVNPITRVTANLGYTEIEETTILGTTIQDGITGGLAVTRDFPLGSVTAEYSREYSTVGHRDTIEVSTTIETPGGSVSAGIGATRANNGDTNMIGNLGYTNEFSMGTITASLDHSYSTSDGGLENRATRAALGFETDLTPVSSISFDLDYAEVTEVLSDTTTTVSGFRATYSHELTQDWGLSAGYEYRKRQETGATDRESNELFVTLEREFSIR